MNPLELNERKKMSAGTEPQWNCPIPLKDYPQILLGHGSGGKLTRRLIENLFAPSFDNAYLKDDHDGAVIVQDGSRLAFTTDSYVVRPLFFPGGDIGSMAVYGTVNDLAMCGAKPLYLSAGFILEEGFSMESLAKIVQSMKTAAARTGVQIVTGDTKVVDKGKGDGIFINTSGIGIIEHGLNIRPKSVQAGDKIILSGDIGRHGMAVMAMREGLCFESQIESDSAPLWEDVRNLLHAKIPIHCLRDLTRGGLASALNEIAEAAGVSIHIEERKIAVRDDVRGACELLGLDPLYVANEGRFIVFVPDAQADAVCRLLQQKSSDASIIGQVLPQSSSWISMTTQIGTDRVVDMLAGDQLPRIC